MPRVSVFQASATAGRVLVSSVRHSTQNPLGKRFVSLTQLVKGRSPENHFLMETQLPHWVASVR